MNVPRQLLPSFGSRATRGGTATTLGLVVLLGSLASNCTPSASCGAAAQPAARLQSAQPKPTVAVQTSHRERLVALQVRLDQLLEDSMGFWLRHGPDPLTGGYHGALDRFGAPVPGAPRGLVQQSRHLWSLSAYYRARPHVPLTRREQVKEQALHLYQYILKAFYDSTDKEFFFRVEAGGNVTDKNKPLYGESFAIYALSEYAAAFDSKQAERYALDCFIAIDKRSHDAKFQGYDQTGTSRWLWSGAAKDTNTHIHLMESFTQLYLRTKDAQVRARTEELLDVVQKRLEQPAHYCHAEFAADFTPFGKASVSYGHDIETAWLLFETLEALGDTHSEKRDQAYVLGTHAAKWGFDPVNGGFFEEGEVDGAPTKVEKIWWVQAEAIAGLFRLYAYRPTEELLSQLERTVEWVERYQRDPNEGEWYWGVLPDGRLGTHRDAKSEEWKSSYHVVRSLLFTSDWISHWLSNVPAK